MRILEAMNCHSCATVLLPAKNGLQDQHLLTSRSILCAISLHILAAKLLFKTSPFPKGAVLKMRRDSQTCIII